MSEKIRIICEISGVVNFAMQQNRIPVIQSLQIENLTDEAIRNVEIRVSTTPVFAHDAKHNLEVIGPRETIEIPTAESGNDSVFLNLILDPHFFMGITERMSGVIEIAACVDGAEEDRVIREISLLAYNEWAGNMVIPALLAAYVTPNHPFVSQVLRRASEKMKEWTGDGSMCGYQRRNENDVLRQMAAIFAAIEEQDIHYSNPPAGFETVGQKIRLCDEIATQKMGTCLDLTLLYASCLEQAGLNPIVVLVKGHAFAGCWLVDETFPSAVQDDACLLTKRFSEDIGEMAVVECIMLANGTNVDFDSARATAQNHFLDEDKFLFFVDIKRARAGGSIRPIPQRKFDAEGHLEKLAEFEDVERDETTWSAPAEVKIADTDESEGPVKYSKQRIWQNKLLNLTLRNSLLNFRPAGKSIQLVCNDLGKLEDSLAAKEEFKIMEFFEEVPRIAEDSFVKIAKNKENDDLLNLEFQSKRLRTFMGRAETEKKIVALYRAAKLSLEENGSNTLYLALGFLKWFESETSERALYAPLVLLPLEIVRKSARQGYIIRERDEDPQFNITLLEKLKGEFDIVINGLDPLPIDESGLDIKKIFSTVRRAIKNKSRWDVVDYAFVGQFSFSQYIMWNDIGARSKELEKNKIVKGLIDGTLPEKLPDLVPVETLDSRFKPTDMAVPLSADSSQLSAICSAAAGCSFVLHGPPGTGKSQTITNMIANALFNGKSVLFIAEKMAALSVVQNRLEKLGLGPFCLELHSNKANKSAVMAQLGAALNFRRRKSPETYAEEGEELHKLRVELNGLMEKIHKVHGSGYSLYETIGMFEEHPELLGKISLNPELLKTADAKKIRQWLDDCGEFKVVAELCGNIAGHPLLDWKCALYSESTREKIDGVLEQLGSLSGHLSELLDSLRQRLSDLKVESREKAKLLKEFFASLGDLDLLPTETLFMDDGTVRQELLEMSKAGRRRNEIKSAIDALYEPEVYGIDAVSLRGQWKEASARWFLPRILGERNVVSALRRMAIDPQAVKKEDVPGLLNDLVEYARLTESINKTDNRLPDVFGRFWKTVDSDWDLLQKQYDQGTTLYGQINALYESVDALASMRRDVANLRVFREKNSALLEDFDKSFSKLEALWNELCSLVGMDGDIEFGDEWPRKLRDRAQAWRNALPKLRDWSNYNARRTVLSKEGLEGVPAALESGTIAIRKITDAFRTNLAYRLTVNYIEEDGSLSQSNANLIEHEIGRYRDSIARFAELTRKELIARLSASIPTTGILTESSEITILKKAIASKCKGRSIRQLFDSIPNLLRKLTPCMLMSPISVAQYINSRYPKFDLVIFDEASQLPTCEAVGAIARGENLVVVGDPKQMPPTSFFKKGFTDEDNIENEDLESILDDCLAISMPEAHLLWHYRSKDESLIAFSNYKYYEQKLFTFPSPMDLEGAVKFIPVKGFYDRSKTRQNRAEAEAVVKEIVRRLRDPKERKKSVGVVTFSVVQQNLIDDLLQEQFARNSKLEGWAKASGEEIFIKNLESVQGDERDVIIFSVGYGPDASGTVSLNFGPINNAGGWRRLNVAVSRSRCEMLVFSTLQPEQIDLSRSSAEGVAGLKAFLNFAKNGKGALAAMRKSAVASGRDNFKISVANELRKYGYRVEIDIGSSRYKMDLAVVHPNNPKKFILGILCDGETYRESATAKDRNVLQQSVLESLGWNIVRLWSFEWFMGREHRDRIVKEIEERIDALIRKEKEDAQRAEQDMDGQGDAADVASVEVADTPEDDLASSEVDFAEEGGHTFASLFKPYMAADISKPPKDLDFYDIGSRELATSQIEKIIEAESPVAEEELQARISSLWNVKRTSRFTRYFDELLKEVPHEEKPEGAGGEKRVFIWKVDDNAPAEFRIPTGGYRRNMENISVFEIAAAVHVLVKDQLSMEMDDLERLIARAAGFTKCTAQMKEIIDEGIELAVKNTLVQKEGSRLKV